MNKRLLIKYVLLCLPFLLGIGLYSLSIFNIYSSILFFCGGYIAVKNLCDYRKIIRNIRLSRKKDNLDNINKEITKNEIIKNKNIDYIPGIKRVRIYKRVRRRY